MGQFYDAVYHFTRLIPPGKVTTYGAIAALAGQPMAPRAVGYALRALPPDSDVPWQRVINKQGKVSPRGADLEKAAPCQRLLLESEGIQFDAEARVDFRVFGWDGPEGHEGPSS